MRIISDFHDYYDISISYGIDPKCIYNRQTVRYIPSKFEEVPSFARLFLTQGHRFFERNDLEKVVSRKFNILGIDFLTVIFCGKIYACYRIEHSYDDYNYTYTAEKTLEILDNSNSSDVREYFADDRSRTKYYRNYGNPRMDVIKSFQVINDVNKTSLPTQILREADAPIILLKSGRGRYPTIYVNPTLKSIDFQKAVDPYTAFQELSMFNSSILGIKENPIVDVSDKSKIEGHGFNKQSFRHPIK